MDRTIFRVRHVLVLTCLAGLLTAVPGCEGDSTEGVPIKVTLILPKRIKLQETDTVELALAPEVEGKPGAVSSIEISKPDQPLVFDFAGEDRPGVPPGFYRIGVRITPYSSSGTPRDDALEQFNMANDTRSLGLSLEVKDGPSEVTQSITVDMIQNSVTDG